MKIAIIGATGQTGRVLVGEGLARGHRITAVARSAASLADAFPAVVTAPADVLDPPTLEAPLRDQDAVVYAVGSGNMKASTLRREGAANVVAAMQSVGTRRLVAMSGLGAGDSRKALPWLVRKIIVPLFLARLLDDQDGMEARIEKSGLDWTLVRPGELAEGPGKGSCKVSLDGAGVSHKVARVDVARFILGAVEKGHYLRQAPAVGY